MRSRVYAVAGVVLVLTSTSLLAEQTKIIKVGRAVVVTVDDPKNDLKYSKCVANFKTEKGEFTFAAVKCDDRTVPAAETLSMDIESDRTVTDGGNTIVTNVFLPDVEFDRTYSFKGQDWSLASQPMRIEVKVAGVKPPHEMKEHTFFAVYVIDKESGEKMLMGCEKAGSVAEVFKTQLLTEKPLEKVAGAVPHAAVQTKNH